MSKSGALTAAPVDADAPRDAGEPTDPQLLTDFVARRDALAFAALIRRHGPMVLGVCRRVLDHEQEAEDAFQATFLILVRRAAALERPELLGNWLYGVAYRTAQKARVRLARRRERERRAEPMATVDPSEELEWRELRGVLDEELRFLPAKYRVPLVLCYFEGMTNEEAARRLGWPAGSISYRLARGRQLLGERLRQRRQALSGLMLLTLLRRHARPEEVPDDLAEATLRVALGQEDDEGPLPPLWPVGDAPSEAATDAPSAKPPRRGRLMVLLAMLGVVAATGVLYAALGGVPGIGGNSANAVTPPLVSATDSAAPSSGCH